MTRKFTSTAVKSACARSSPPSTTRCSARPDAHERGQVAITRGAGDRPDTDHDIGTRMQLLIDLGNTRLKWALLSSGAMSARGALVHTDADADADITSALESEWVAL